MDKLNRLGKVMISLTATDEGVLKWVRERNYKIDSVVRAVRGYVPTFKQRREISAAQAAILWLLARQYNHPRTQCIEIGTAIGWSACFIAEAIRKGHLATLNPREDEYQIATGVLARYPHVTPIMVTSQAYLRTILSEKPKSLAYDMIFVDGDHARVADDLPYFNLLKVGGLMLFHDYSTPGSWRECPPVWDAVNQLAETTFKRPPDVHVQDPMGVGMAGWYRMAKREKIK